MVSVALVGRKRAILIVIWTKKKRINTLNNEHTWNLNRGVITTEYYLVRWFFFFVFLCETLLGVCVSKVTCPTEVVLPAAHIRVTDCEGFYTLSFYTLFFLLQLFLSNVEKQNNKSVQIYSNEGCPGFQQANNCFKWTHHWVGVKAVCASVKSKWRMHSVTHKITLEILIFASFKI